MYREINLCAEYLDQPVTEVCATMLHGIADLYNLLHGIGDTSNNGYYHNKRFKDTAEGHGLIIEKHSKYDWTITTLSAEVWAWLKDTLGDDAINTSRLPEGTGLTGGTSKSKNRSIKYVCPECGILCIDRMCQIISRRNFYV